MSNSRSTMPSPSTAQIQPHRVARRVAVQALSHSRRHSGGVQV
jgi:hypothetical protein